MSTVNTLCQGMEHVKEESTASKTVYFNPDDLFAAKMEPFIRKMEPAVHSLRYSGQALESELKDLLSYFGETLEGSEATKPEDFFNLMLSFSRALQVSSTLDLIRNASKERV